MVTHYLCSRLSKSDFSCTTCHYVDYTKYYCMVSDLSAFDWMEILQTWWKKNTFCEAVLFWRSKFFLLLSSFALTFGISILSLLIYSVITGKLMLSYISMETTALPLSIFLSFTSGPTGEELGWRGFWFTRFCCILDLILFMCF